MDKELIMECVFCHRHFYVNEFSRYNFCAYDKSTLLAIGVR